MTNSILDNEQVIQILRDVIESLEYRAARDAVLGYEIDALRYLLPESRNLDLAILFARNL
jgi:hypothetical protein